MYGLRSTALRFEENRQLAQRQEAADNQRRYDNRLKVQRAGLPVVEYNRAETDFVAGLLDEGKTPSEAAALLLARNASEAA